MDWLSANWVWVLIAVAFVAMHMFGHGGHGGHGSHDGDEENARRGPSQKREEVTAPSHRH